MWRRQTESEGAAGSGERQRNEIHPSAWVAAAVDAGRTGGGLIETPAGLEEVCAHAGGDDPLFFLPEAWKENKVGLGFVFFFVFFPFSPFRTRWQSVR